MSQGNKMPSTAGYWIAGGLLAVAILGGTLVTARGVGDNIDNLFDRAGQGQPPGGFLPGKIIGGLVLKVASGLAGIAVFIVTFRRRSDFKRRLASQSCPRTPPPMPPRG